MVNELYEQQTARNGDTKRNEIISTSASIIKSDVMLIPANKGIYPSAEMLSNLEAQNDFLPDTLHHRCS